MQKKFFALLLTIICLMAITLGTVTAAPAQGNFEYTFEVDEDGNIIEPRAAVLSCGLTNTSGSNYYAWAMGSDGGTRVTVSVYLYKNGSQISQNSKSGTGTVVAQTSTKSLSSGSYPVRGYISGGPTGTNSTSRSYSI